MKELRFVQADVFTGEAFGGNQLAVFTAGDGLERPLMETLAREMNFSESTFIQAATRPDCAVRVRICVPGREIPFAGHPVVGTAVVLFLAGRIPARCVLELGVGPLAVEVEKLDERRGRAVMTQPRVTFGPPQRQESQLAAALGLTPADLDPHFPVRSASNGLPMLLVPVRTRAALAGIKVDAGRLGPLLAGAASEAVYAYTLDSPDPGAAVHARMFAPDLGITEDPATGSAAGPLAAHLADSGFAPALPGQSFVIRQGVEMGRPSSIHCQVLGLVHANEGVRVSGETCVVGDGRIFVPGAP